MILNVIHSEKALLKFFMIKCDTDAYLCPKNHDLKYSFIYFDLDDTLLDHKHAERNALFDTWSHFNLEHKCTVDQLQHTYHQINVYLWELYGKAELTKELLQQYRFERTLFRLNIELNWKIVSDYYISRYAEHWKWIDGAKEAFYSIKKKYPVGILTNGFAEVQHHKLEKFALMDESIITVISEEIGIMKPQPGIFEKATELAGEPKEQILYVGDSFTSDVVGGSNYGWDVAWFTNEDKESNAKLVFNDWTHLLEFVI